MEELEKAHQDYEKRRYEILSKLNTIRDYALLKRHEREWIEQVIEFINEKEI